MKGCTEGKISVDHGLITGIEWSHSEENRMQTVDTARDDWYRHCSRCGKECFSDLLDADGLCDYCREIRAMKATKISDRKKRTKTR